MSDPLQNVLSMNELSNTNNVSTEPNKPFVSYVKVPFIVFLLLNFVTLGIYRIYWLYANWKAIKKAEKSNISPLWRAIFSVFFISQLFDHIILSARSQGYKRITKLGLLDGCYITFVVLGGTFYLINS
jgi:hypothetical protein